MGWEKLQMWIQQWSWCERIMNVDPTMIVSERITNVDPTVIMGWENHRFGSNNDHGVGESQMWIQQWSRSERIKMRIQQWLWCERITHVDPTMIMEWENHKCESTSEKWAYCFSRTTLCLDNHKSMTNHKHINQKTFYLTLFYIRTSHLGYQYMLPNSDTAH